MRVRGETVIDGKSMRVLVSPAGPAARAGVRSGDRILSYAGERVTDRDRLKRLVAEHGQAPAAIELSGPFGVAQETSSAAEQGLLTSQLLAAALAVQLLPLVALGSAIYELLNRCHELARLARASRE